MEYIFAGNVSIPKEIQASFASFPGEWEYLVTERPDRKTIYLQGHTDFRNSEELLGYIQSLTGDLLSFDISHTGDPDPDEIELFQFSEGRSYSYLAVHGEDFQSVYDRYRDQKGVASIRTAEVSKHLGGKVIKIDTIS